MNQSAALLLAVCVVALLCLPRRWALIPLLGGTCYLGFGEGIEIGAFHFTSTRILITAAFLRVTMRMEWLSSGLNTIDRIMVLWAICMGITSRFHDDPTGDLIFKLGNIYTICGMYFLLRIFFGSFADVVRLCKATAILIVPLAAGMMCEQVLMRNPFAVLGSVPETPMVRDGRIRGFGTFSHPILAGTVGAVTLPLMAFLWRRHRGTALLGGAACLSMIVSSGSSGPVMSAVFGIVALCFWRYRRSMRAFRWAAVVVYIVLDLVMKVPAYYIIARLDVTGSSTGWHRARLIESGLEHLSEWWFAGTDHTRHWMPTGVTWNPNHTDITNHYLAMGVMGGLPLMFIFIWLLVKGFSYVGTAIRTSEEAESSKFMFWALGSALFAQATTMISVSYFDQSVIFLYITLAAIGSACHVPHAAASLRGSTQAQTVGV